MNSLGNFGLRSRRQTEISWIKGTGEAGRFQSEGKACPWRRTEIDPPLLPREKVGAFQKTDTKIESSFLNEGREVQP